MRDATSIEHLQLSGELLNELESHKAQLAAAAAGVLLLAATRGKVNPEKIVDYAQDGLRLLGVGSDSEWTRGLRSLKELADGRTDAALLRKARWVMPDQIDHVKAMLGKPTAAKVIDVGWQQAIAVKHGERGTSLLLKEDGGMRVVTAASDGSFSTMTPAKSLFASDSEGARFKLPHLELTSKADSLSVKTENGSKAELSLNSGLDSGLDSGNVWHGRFNGEQIASTGKTRRFDMDTSTSLRSYQSKFAETQNSAGQNFLVESKDRIGTSWINTKGADGYSVRHHDEGAGFTFSQLPSGARHLAIGPRPNPLVSFRVDVPEGANIIPVKPEQASNQLYVRLPFRGYSDFNSYESVDKLLKR
ncbi:MAG: hypothetical protein P4L53_20800 [Candidatus Obscuribacterales bacterium]|nr:hypothetical protein [Candidatus Obscuribacterales bacterium]